MCSLEAFGLLGKEVVDGDGGVDGGGLTVEVVGSVGPLADGVKGGGAEFIRAGDYVERIEEPSVSMMA